MQNDPTSSSVLDPARLTALRDFQILDTAPEAGFDDAVRLASRLCHAPVALVSLVASDRQWFKANVGFPYCETDLDRSVCQHILAEPDLLVIPDLTRDARTAANPLVTGEPHLRFYAGAPLRTAEGQVLGSLCVIDTVSRPGGLLPDQAEDLRALGRQVSSLLELRRAAANEKRSRAATVADAARMEAMLAVQRAVASATSDLHTIFQAVASGALAVLREATGAVMELHGSDGLVHRATAGSSTAPAGRRLSLQGSPLDRVVGGGTAVYCPDTERDPAVDKRLARELGIRSTIMVPVSRHGGAVGVLEVQSDRADAFEPRDVLLAQMLGGLVASTFGEVAEGQVAERGRSASQRAAMQVLSDRLRDVDTREGIVAAAGEVVGTTLGVSRAGYCTVDVEREIVLVEQDWHRPELAGIAGRHTFRNYGNYVESLKRGDDVIIDDVWCNPATIGQAATLERVQGRALVNLPIMDRGRFVGLLFALSAEPRHWHGDELDFMRDVADRTRAAVARIEAEERQHLLNHELSHRLKNTLAIVLSIASQTLRTVAEREPVQAFEKRVMALSRAHDVLLQDAWASASIRAVAVGVLGPHAALDRFDLQGPEIGLAPAAALSLSMLLHELATNAAKYGALSTEAGRVRLAWEVTEPEATLEMRWRERGGPPTVAPMRRGFGSRLIRTGLAGTRDAAVHYTPEGLEAVFRAPLARVALS